MEIKNRVEALEGEFKLIKGELKETLASVRDYLMDLKLPPAEDTALMAGIIEEESPIIRSEVIMSSIAPQPSQVPPQVLPPQVLPPQAQQPQVQPPQAQQPQAQQPQVQQPQVQQPQVQPHEVQQLAAEELAELPELEMYELDMAGPDMQEQPPEKQEALRGNVSRGAARQEASLSTPQVNLLANLIRWVSNAKKDIGSEQLPVFLEVYGISGHLSPELKDAILHLAEISEPRTADENAADVWSQLIMELHGILTGGDAPLHPVKPFWGQEAEKAAPVELEATELAAEQPTEELPFKLKLVLPGSDGKGKEYSISLNPETEIENIARRQPPEKKPRNER